MNTEELKTLEDIEKSFQGRLKTAITAMDSGLQDPFQGWDLRITGIPSPVSMMFKVDTIGPEPVYLASFEFGVTEGLLATNMLNDGAVFTVSAYRGEDQDDLKILTGTITKGAKKEVTFGAKIGRHVVAVSINTQLEKLEFHSNV